VNGSGENEQMMPACRHLIVTRWISMYSRPISPIIAVKMMPAPSAFPMTGSTLIQNGTATIAATAVGTVKAIVIQYQLTVAALYFFAVASFAITRSLTLS
jgi:hypothetical protein